MAGTLIPAPWLQFVDANGAPYGGGKLYTYDAGTNNARITYQDAALTVLNDNPIILDAAGRCTIYISETDSLKLVLKDKNNAPVRTQDIIASVALSAAALTALSAIKDGTYVFAGSDGVSLLGVAAPAGSGRVARAPGTGLFVITIQGNFYFEGTLWAEAGAQANVFLASSGAPDAPIANSTLQSAHAEGERVKSAQAITLPAGTYLIKGHSNHAVNQAWGVGYRIVPV